MNLKALIIVALRLLAINLVIQGLVAIVPFGLLPYSQRGEIIATSVVVTVCLLTFASLTWYFAPSVANFVSSGLPQEISFGALSLTDCYTVAFVGVGVFQIAAHLGSAIFWAFYLFKAAASSPGDAWKQGVNPITVWQSFIPLVIGAVLFVNGRRWAVALARRQTGSPPSEPASPTAAENK